MTKTITSRQDEIRSKIRALNKSLKDIKSAHPEWDPKAGSKSPQQVAYERAVTYVSFVETDGSFGWHNYEYAKAALAKAEAEMTLEVPTPTPTLTSTPPPTDTPAPPTPVPTPTPIPPPSGGTTWSMWGLLAAVIGVMLVLLLVRRPERG